MSSSSRHAVIIGGGVIGTACAYFPPPAVPDQPVLNRKSPSESSHSGLSNHGSRDSDCGSNRVIHSAGHNGTTVSDQPHDWTSDPISRLGSTPCLTQRCQLDRAVAFGQATAVGGDGEGDVAELRGLPAEGLVKENLPRRAGHEVVAADDLVHTRERIVHDHR